jgi:hypothetical protein
MNKYVGDSNQEAFVLDVLDYKRDGFYVELGAFHSSEGSNTYALEKSFGWQGVSFELVDERREEFISVTAGRGMLNERYLTVLATPW